MNLTLMTNFDVTDTTEKSQQMRLTVVLDRKLSPGPAANAAAIVIGGLSAGFGPSVEDLSGNAHAAILWNLVVLKADSSQRLVKLLDAARTNSVKTVAFSTRGQALSNSFLAYEREIQAASTADLEIVAVALYGPEEKVRALTRSFSLF
jgi:hypothetical protein